MRWRLPGVLPVVCLAAACSSSTMPDPQAPSLERAGASVSCARAARNYTPLLVEWSASEKANLEANLAGGAIAVEYTGCEMRLLSGCALPGAYEWQRTTTATDVIDIDSQAELHTLLPLGAVRLEGELSRSGSLSVKTTVAGQLRLSGSVPVVPEGGACSRATHVLQAVSVGAFRLDSGAKLHSGIGADVSSVSAGASSRGSQTILRRAGNPESCALATPGEPHAECRSPLQAFLTPLPRTQLDQGPAGSVQATFVSSDADLRWELRQNGETLCTTPCTRWVRPTETLLLRAYGRDGEPSSRGDTVAVPSLRAFSPGQVVHVTAEPRSLGAFVGGITTVSIGGAAIFFGGFFGLFGQLAERSGMSTGGLITAGVGAGLGAVGVTSIVMSAPDAEAAAERVTRTGSTAPMLRLRGEF